MTDQPADHAPFEELAAGYALDALEPADEQLFHEHARGCPDCSRILAGFRDVAAALAETAPPAAPSPQLADRIMAVARAGRAGEAATGTAISGESVAGKAGQDKTERDKAERDEARKDEAAELPPGVRRLPSRRTRWVRRTAVAAAVVLIGAGGVWGGLEATRQHPATFCAHGCNEVALAAAGGTHQAAGRVYVDRGTVFMRPTGIKPDDTADQIYVLWQITNGNKPLAVGSFDVRGGVHAPVKIGPLATPYGGTKEFAVSLEKGRSVPALPTKVVAVGPVS